MTSVEFLYRLAGIEKELHFAAWFRSTPTSSMVWSSGMYEMLGIHPSVRATNDLFLKAIYPDDRLAASLSAVSAGDGERVAEQVFRVVRPDGSIHAVRSIVHQLADKDATYKQLGLLFDEADGPSHRSLATDMVTRLGFLSERTTEGGDQSTNEITDLEPSALLDPPLIRAARGLLDWSAHDLAEAAGLSFSTVRRSERATNRAIKHQSNATIRRTLESHGLRFVEVGSLTGLLVEKQIVPKAPKAGH